MKAADRALSTEETALLRWLLEHGSEDSKRFLSQVDQARVIGLCECGCATLDLSVDGKRGDSQHSRVLVDYLGKTAAGHDIGVMVWLSDEILSGLEVYGLGCEGADIRLPLLDSLQPWERPAEKPRAGQ